MAKTELRDLPDEILTEILVRVSTPENLVHAAATSKSWRAAVANPGFLARYRERQPSSPFLGIYAPRQFAGLPSFHMPDPIRSGDVRDLKDAASRAFFLGDIRRYQDHRRHVDDTFIHDRLEVHSDCRVLDCHNSRLLLTRGDEALEVSSPLARESIVIPFPPDVVDPKCLQACLLHGHDKAAAASFRVVCLQHHRPPHSRWQTRAVEYDSRRRSWQDHPCKKTITDIMEGTPEKVMHAGHRIFCKYRGVTSAALVLDTNNMQFSILPLPSYQNFAIGEIEDNVCCFVETHGCADHRLKVWLLDEDEKGLHWDLNKDIEMNQVFGEHLGFYHPRAISNGIVLLCSSTTDRHFVVDLKTFSMKEEFEFHGQCAYPMQMPWPPIFSTNAVGGFDRDRGPASVGTQNCGLSKGKKRERVAVSTGECKLLLGGSGSTYKFTDVGKQPIIDVSITNAPSLSDPSVGESAGQRGEAVQDSNATASAPTSAAAEQCFGKDKNYVPNDYLIPEICDEFSDPMNTKAAATAALQEEMKALVASIPDGAGAAFTAMQLQELEQQSRVYHQYMAAQVPMPTHLVFPVWKSITGASSEGAQKYPTLMGLATLCLDFGKNPEPEPGRCRRTDGRKWRCWRSTIPNEKYCERHMHLGRKRPVQVVVEADEPDSASGSKSAPGKATEGAKKADDKSLDNDLLLQPPALACCPQQVMGLATLCLDFGKNPEPEPGRCRRTDGKKWRCWRSTIPNEKYCERHMHLGHKLPVQVVVEDDEPDSASGSKSAPGKATEGAKKADDKSLDNDLLLQPPALACCPQQVMGLATLCLDFGKNPEPEPGRCRRTDGKKWRCWRSTIPNEKYCERHMHLGRKRPTPKARPVPSISPPTPKARPVPFIPQQKTRSAVYKVYKRRDRNVAVEAEELLVCRSQSPSCVQSLGNDLLLQPPVLACCPQQGRKRANSRQTKASAEDKGPERCNCKWKPKFLEALFASRRCHSFSIASKSSDEVQIATSSCREASAASTAAVGLTIKFTDSGKQPTIDVSITSAPSPEARENNQSLLAEQRGEAVRGKGSPETTGRWKRRKKLNSKYTSANDWVG